MTVITALSGRRDNLTFAVLAVLTLAVLTLAVLTLAVLTLCGPYPRYPSHTFIPTPHR